ncbi:1-phosphofructokinase [Peribacillus deserti]|uniref:Tagatose-6-phosphate kinase n=1 Tax=Peribacillus deserti TaxID=673318 RepID=A0ABS2QN64_9BACI|nr:1-phosphofructokinase [Peribacillus deserti]MBM7694542.1 1-phosphofructokinase [Peribacillus deserti]
MIYTVTLNPSIDYIVEVEDFQINSLNRMKQEAKFPGGKGINVSRVLSRIGSGNKALGFIGGFTGSFIESFLQAENVHMDFTHIAEDTRINIKLKTGKETEINGLGPKITEENYQELLAKIDRLASQDTIVLAGSVPPSFPPNFYETVTKRCAQRGVKVVVDTSGPSLMDVVKHRPFLIKPNHHELGDLFSVEIETVKDAAFYAKKLIEAGARNVIVSMAGEGAVLQTEGKTYTAGVPRGNVVNSVGAGDSVVAGFIGKYTKTNDIIQAFKYGIAAGSATAFSTDLCQKQEIEALLPQVHIQQLEEDIK